MIVSCPKCKAKYRFNTLIKNAILVCHRCGNEFNSNPETIIPQQAPDAPSLFTPKSNPPIAPLPHFLTKNSHIPEPPSNDDKLEDETSEKTEKEQLSQEKKAKKPLSYDNRVEKQAENNKKEEISNNIEHNTPENPSIEEKETNESQTTPEAPHEMIAPTHYMDMPAKLDFELTGEHFIRPQRRQARLWTWLIGVLCVISGIGVWQNIDQWQKQSWVRSAMINLQYPMPKQRSDWHIDKDNLHSQWITRQDKSRVLFIDGYVYNQILADQTPPTLQVGLLDMPNSAPLSVRYMHITEPPSLPQIRHAPYTPPAVDNIPVSAHGKRAFTLIIEDIPEHIREISLAVAKPRTP